MTVMLGGPALKAGRSGVRGGRWRVDELNLCNTGSAFHPSASLRSAFGQGLQLKRHCSSENI
jgi:hypothetical protein